MDVPKKQPGDFLLADEINTIVQAALKSRAVDNGFVDGSVDTQSGKDKTTVRWFQVHNDDDEAIEKYSIFSIVGNPEFDYDEPIKVAAHKIGVDSLNGGNHTF